MASRERQETDRAPIAEIDRLVHEPARLSILGLLTVVERAEFLYLLRQTGLTRGNLSSHLSTLEKAGYVEVKKEFVDVIGYSEIPSRGLPQVFQLWNALKHE